ncbi:hypothetical protein PCANC_13032 [Puccinia coronata f. sp. avenae]|uniref:Uncharacterized protein n=1 Tax=Puccinia coronata f. sp. avenae TaxID=200324 RepID=A0A2N5US78_9BASI|nr:hypothetical protein PCANC_13032 [Puccinia coronata f. sp. avenae]
MSKIFNPTYYPTMILNLHSLSRFAWGVALAHAGPPEEEQDGSLYLDASLALNPGGVNQKRPAENQVDFPKDYLGAEAHYAPLDLHPKLPGDSKRQRKGQCEYGGSSSNSHLGHDFLSLGISPDKSYWPMLPGTSQVEQSRQRLALFLMIYAFRTTQDNKMIYRMKDITRMEN